MVRKADNEDEHKAVMHIDASTAFLWPTALMNALIFT
jgi:hypothetical protein